MKKILLSVAAVSVLFLGCTEDTKEEVKATTNKAIDSAAKTTQNLKDEATTIAQEVSDKTEEVVDSVAKTSKNLKDEVTNMAQKASDTTKEAAKTVSEKTTPIVKEAAVKTKEMINEVSASVVKTKDEIKNKIHTATAPKADGKALYKACGACHGQNGEKKALNASKVIQGWSKEQIISSLKGYKDGTYGGPMKGIMTGQVKNLDDDKIEALATYISSF